MQSKAPTNKRLNSSSDRPMTVLRRCTKQMVLFSVPEVKQLHFINFLERRSDTSRKSRIALNCSDDKIFSPQFILYYIYTYISYGEYNIENSVATWKNKHFGDTLKARESKKIKT